MNEGKPEHVDTAGNRETYDGPALELRDVHFYYGGVHALKGVSLMLQPGETVAMIGANGAGKSTTLRVISGLLRRARGQILYFGEDIAGLPPEAIVARGISHCPEGRQVFRNLTVVENLRVGAYLQEDRRVVNERLQKVYSVFPRLYERRTQNAGTLSGGEQEMLALGRALMSRPKLLLLDEPSLGLAPIMVETLFDTIAEICRDGTTVLLVEQNAGMALGISARGYVMETGRVILEGDARELLTDDAVREAYLGG